MSESAKKWLLSISLITMFLSICGIVSSSISVNDIFLALGILLLALSILALVVIYSIKYPDRKWLRKAARLSLYLLPLYIILILFLMFFTTINGDSPLFIIPAICVAFILMILILIHIFILVDASETRGTIFLLFFILLGVICKRFHLPGSSQILVISLSLTGFGIFMFGVRCLFLAEKNTYMRIISFTACTLLTAASIGFMYKMQRWPGAGILISISNIPMILLTVIVLLSLPVSGYINWSKLHKNIFKRILIIWLFFLIISSIHFVFPSFSNTLFTKDLRPRNAFFMYNYDIDNKNGLEPK